MFDNLNTAILVDKEFIDFVNILEDNNVYCICILYTYIKRASNFMKDI